MSSVVMMRRSRQHRLPPQEWTKILVRLKAADEVAFRQIAASEGRSPPNLLRYLAVRYIAQNKGISPANLLRPLAERYIAQNNRQKRR
jgi:hypothetical protein